MSAGRVSVVLCDPEGYPTSIAPASVIAIGAAVADVLVYDCVPRTLPLAVCFPEERHARAALVEAQRAYASERIAALASGVAHA